MANCYLCGTCLSLDEIGLNKKMINRNAVDFMCKKCLAKYFNVNEKLLDDKIEDFRKSGCALFCTFEKKD